MTKLQVTINNLEDVLTSGNRLLLKLKEASEDLENLKAPEFPRRFFVAKDAVYSDMFVIGLQDDVSLLKKHDELPPDFRGRTCFNKRDIQQIIVGLQTLLGDRK